MVNLRRHATPHEPPRALMLARRVLPMDEYVAELREDKNEVTQRLKRRFGVRVVAIPVPLAPGDTADQYEERFFQLHAAYRNASDQGSAVGERAARCLFARRVTKEYSDQTKRVETVCVQEPPHRPQCPTPTTAISQALSHVGNTQRFVELDQFRKDYHSGRLASYKTLTKVEKIARFGVPVVPIFVPLARGESAQQYEARFIAWLATKQHITLDDVHRHANPAKERALRLRFASLNGQGAERFNPTRWAKRERDDSAEDETEKSIKKPRHTHKSDNASLCRAAGETSLGAYTACGCDACLVSAVKLWAAKAARREQAIQCLCRPKRRRLPVVLDLTQGDDDDPVAIDLDTSSSDADDSWAPAPSPESVTSDAVEDRLCSVFDELNEQIVLNHKALDAAVDELVVKPPVDLADMTKLHEENEEMRALLAEECDKRTTALALLILYVWRHDHRLLERMVNDKTASDVAHVQRLRYEKCMELANALAHATHTCSELQQLVDVTGDRAEELATAHGRMDELRHQRRQELLVLVHFDSTLRQCLARLLERLPVT